MESIRAVHNGTYTLPAEIAARLAQRRAAPELSPRELEVLLLIVKGNSNKEIGSRLSLAEDDRTGRIRQGFEVRRELSERYPFEPLEQIDLTKKTRIAQVISLRTFSGAFPGRLPLFGL